MYLSEIDCILSQNQSDLALLGTSSYLHMYMRMSNDYCNTSRIWPHDRSLSSTIMVPTLTNAAVTTKDTLKTSKHNWYVQLSTWASTEWVVLNAILWNIHMCHTLISIACGLLFVFTVYIHGQWPCDMVLICSDVCMYVCECWQVVTAQTYCTNRQRKWTEQTNSRVFECFREDNMLLCEHKTTANERMEVVHIRCNLSGRKGTKTSGRERDPFVSWAFFFVSFHLKMTRAYSP